MLKGIDPILNADILHVLKSMGHGDELIVADMNFPSDAIARQTTYGRLVRMENVTAGRAAEAILSLMPPRFVCRKTGAAHGNRRPARRAARRTGRSAGINRQGRGSVVAHGLHRALRLL